MKSLTLRGLFPATATPFAPDLSVDEEALRRHLKETAAAEGVQGLVVNGHAGEVIALTSDERELIVREAVRARRPSQLVIAGVESHTIQGGVAEGLRAKRAGADALLVLPPFDIRPYRHLSRFEGPVLRFFEALDRDVDLPMVVFAYADKSGVSYPVDILVKLAELKNIVAVKSAVGTVTRHTDVWDALHDKVSVLAACDAPELLGMLLYGAHGALIGISVVGPVHWAKMVDAAINGRAEEAREIYNRVCIPLMRGLFENQEPSGAVTFLPRVKEALVQLGQIPSSRVRPLAVDADDAERKRAVDGLKKAGLLEGAAKI